LIASHVNLAWLSARPLPDFDFSVEVKGENCCSDGGLKFSVRSPPSGAKITYSILLQPNLDNPITVQEEAVLEHLGAGDYRIIATMEIDGESSRQHRDVTIDHIYQPIEFNIISADICQVQDGKITVEMISGSASSYQIQGPVDMG